MTERELVRSIDTTHLTAMEVLLAVFDASNELVPGHARILLLTGEQGSAEQDARARAEIESMGKLPMDTQMVLLPQLADAMRERLEGLGFTLEVGQGDDEVIRIWRVQR